MADRIRPGYGAGRLSRPRRHPRAGRKSRPRPHPHRNRIPGRAPGSAGMDGPACLGPAYRTPQHRGVAPVVSRHRSRRAATGPRVRRRQEPHRTRECHRGPRPGRVRRGPDRRTGLGLGTVVGRDRPRRVPGGAARLAWRTRQRHHQRHRRRFRCRIGCNTSYSAVVTAGLPQSDRGSAAGAVRGPHRRYSTTAPRLGPQLRPTVRRRCRWQTRSARRCCAM